MAFKAFLTQFAHRSRSCGYSQRDNINGGRSRLRVQLHPGQTVVRGWAIALTGLVGGLIGLTVTLQPVHAEPRAANDGTGTNVREDGPGQFDIDGGQLSGDGANLFHSFQEFGLDANQIANFLSDANIRNIISRVVGGNPSMIDGLIRVSGGDSNLFLLNPSGVIFGQNARLDVPGSFSASTATGIGIGDRWFNVSGDNDYASLVGTPSQFAFRTQTPGSVINAGELRVAEGQSITLLGGTVINTGTVEGSEILITAVPGESLVRLSQDGHVLSLEVAAIAPEQADAAGLIEWSSPVASIPELLTGGNVGHATGLQVNEDGTVSLNGSQISTEPGSVTISGRVDATNTSPNGDARGGSVAIAGSDIQVIDATIDASGRTGGGEIYIGGDQRGEGTFPTSDRTVVDANSVISANAIETGDGGRIIVWADDATHFSGSINARGGATSGDGGFVEISGKSILVFLGVVDLSADNGELGTLLLDPENIRIVNGDGGADDGQLGDGQILAGDGPGANFTISEDVLENIIGNVILEATNDITIETLRGGGDVGLVFLAVDPATGVPGGTITFRADADSDGVGDFSMDTGDIIVTSGRDITIQGANVTTGDIVSQSLFNFGQEGLFTFGESGDIRIEADNDITVGHLIAQNDSFPSGDGIEVDPDAGDVTLVSQQGDVLVQSIDARSFFGEGGTVLLDGDTVRIVATIGDSIFASETDTSIDVTGEISNNVETSPGLDDRTPEGDGQITIRHAGGPENVPFTVGDASVNGSTGELLQGIVLDENGNEVGRRAIAPNQSFVVRPNGGEAPGTPAGVTIESVNTPPTITGPATVVIRQNQRAQIAIQDYLPATDPNRDTVTVTIESITVPRGGSLRLNGRNVTPGTVVTAEDTLVYTPPRRRRENVDAFFTLRADDGVATDAQDVQVDVGVVRRRRDDNGNGNGNGNNGNGNNGGNLPDDSGDSVLDLPGELDRDINGEEVDDVEEPGVANFNIENANRTTVLDTYISSLEYEYVQSFTDYLNLPVQPELTTAEEAKDIARLIEEATGEKPAFVYVNFVPEALDVLPGDWGEPRDTDQLELVVITAEGNMFRQRVPDATRDKVMAIANQFRQDITSPFRRDRHQQSAQQLYEWIIAPIQDELVAREITNLSFLAEAGLRSLPYAALYDGESYLVEQYSVGLMPSLSLTDTLYVDIRNSEMLAMGVSESTQGQAPLPSVPVELSTLVFDVWRGSLHLNENVTLENLKEFRERTPFGIIHMATHADFKAGPIEESYIQLWEERLQMDQVRQLGWSDPPVEMLVLSACRTALGNEQAELGFAGLAVQTGVKSAIASLWYVNDTATTALMTNFYDVLNEAPIKADALRQAQIAMLRGEIRVEDGFLYVPGLTETGIQLPEGSLTNVDLSHPYYWSGFTIVGNPW